jgi:UDP-N-acetylmuramoyl-tripeptide--D-alanyl-D-alanine ligase
MILGDMFELGQESQFEHKAIVDQLSNEDNVECYFIGTAFYDNKFEKSNFRFYNTFEAFSNDLPSSAFSNNTILIKGSRGMALERSLDFFS